LAEVSKLLSETAVSFHSIDCNDINSAKSRNPNLWPLNYLKYNDFWWNLICSEKFNSQNRLREFEFINLLESIGLKTLYVESDTHKGDIERLREFPLAKRFQKMPLESLAVSHSKVCSTKSYISDTRREIVLDGWRKWYK